MTDYNVKLSSPSKYKVVVSSGGILVPANFEDLLNFDYTDKKDKYVIMYNASTQKYTLVNPDKVLSASAVTETTQPGLPANFESVLDVDLDNRINLDGGSF